MDADRRKALEERRRFMHERLAARAFREGIEPALSAMEAANEKFRVYRLGTEPQWNPGWVPAGYSYIPWQVLEGVHTSPRIDEREQMAEFMTGLLADRVEQDGDLLFVPDGKGWSVGLTRDVWERHAVALLDAAWDSAYLVAPPAQWLIFGDWSRVLWKDA
ncbi:hypothetical protein ACWPMX_12240 [Tsuneonella sp. HG094]